MPFLPILVKRRKICTYTCVHTHAHTHTHVHTHMPTYARAHTPLNASVFLKVVQWKVCSGWPASTWLTSDRVTCTVDCLWYVTLNILNKPAELVSQFGWRTEHQNKKYTNWLCVTNIILFYTNNDPVSLVKCPWSTTLILVVHVKIGTLTILQNIVCA